MGVKSPEFYADFRSKGIFKKKIILFLIFFGTPKSISYFCSIVSECDGGNRTRNLGVNTWRLKPLTYGPSPIELRPVTVKKKCIEK